MHWLCPSTDWLKWNDIVKKSFRAVSSMHSVAIDHVTAGLRYCWKKFLLYRTSDMLDLFFAAAMAQSCWIFVKVWMKGEVGVVEDGNKNTVEAECLTQSDLSPHFLEAQSLTVKWEDKSRVGTENTENIHMHTSTSFTKSNSQKVSFHGSK